jgi:hypothetical protein
MMSKKALLSIGYKKIVIDMDTAVMFLKSMEIMESFDTKYAAGETIEMIGGNSETVSVEPLSEDRYAMGKLLYQAVMEKKKEESKS